MSFTARLGVGAFVEVVYLVPEGVGSVVGVLDFVRDDDVTTALLIRRADTAWEIDVAAVIAVRPGPTETELRALFGDR